MPGSTGPRSRVFEQRRIWQLPPDVFDAAALAIAGHVRAYRPELVVGVARGGLPLAGLVGKVLAAPVVAVEARHNRSSAIGVQATGDVRVAVRSKQLQEWRGARVLVVDDICGTGATLAAVTKAVEEALQPVAVHCATLCRNVGSPVAPHAWVWDVADWVVFPWEACPAQDPMEALPWPSSVRRGSGL
jgi:uncharacterized protein